MAIEGAISPRRPAHSDVALPRNASNELERMTICARQPAASATIGPIRLADGASPQVLLDAVEDQRLTLLNVLGIVHCMSDSFVDEGEVSAAFALLEQEIQRVVAGLEEASLGNAM
jgi:hypothetical protein